MDLIRAAENVMTFVSRRSDWPEKDRSPERSEDGRGTRHAVWMLEEVRAGRVKGEKGHRWLGYAQGILTETGLITLEQGKHANLLS